MQQTLMLRHRIIKAMRDYFDEHGFIEIETPMLGRSTPEGARDYLVPSRVHHGKFYALPQSPQLYKQILMVAGYDRYVQVARCFRDEDLRADRQPEFTQLDMEMSFVDADDVIGMIDGLVAQAGQGDAGPGSEAAAAADDLRRGDGALRPRRARPALRHGARRPAPTWPRECEFRVFRGAADGGGRVRGINAKGAAAKYSRKDIDELTDFVVQDFGAKGLAWFKVEDGGKLASPIAKNFTPELLAKIAERMDAEPGDLLLFVADKFEVTCKALYGLRKRFGEELKLYDPQGDALLLGRRVPDVRLGRRRKALGGDAPSVHRAAAAGLASCSTTDPGKCRAQAYDLVINGYEAGGGTIRIHDPEMQQQVFDLLGIDAEAGAASGSASCSTRCNSARRRTAASPWASTAG